MAKRNVDRELDQFLDGHGYQHSRRKAPVPGRSAPLPLKVSRPPQDPVALVRTAAQEMGSEGRFYDKVYIAAIWDAIGDQLHMSLPDFKRWLVEQNQQRKLTLSRGDLVGAMDRELLRRSEIQDRGATFHFVMDPSGPGF